MKTWVFSAKADLILFILLPISLWSLKWFNPSRDFILFLIYFSLFLDTFHTYMTAVPVVADPVGERRAYIQKALLILFATFLLFFAVGLYSHYGGNSFVILTGQLLSYGAAWHFYRQQYGWMRISSKKDPQYSVFSFRLDSFMIMMGTLGPVLISHSPLVNKVWFMGIPYAFTLEPGVGLILNIFYWLTILSYIVLQYVLKTYKVINYNWPKYIVIASTFFCWYMSLMHIESSGEGPLVGYIIFIHAIPYLYLNIANIKNGFAQASRLTVLTLFGLCMAYLFVQSARYYFPQTRYRLPPFFPINLTWLPEQLHLAIWCLLLTPIFAHYIIDGFVWKNRKIGSYYG